MNQGKTKVEVVLIVRIDIREEFGVSAASLGRSEGTEGVYDGSIDYQYSVAHSYIRTRFDGSVAQVNRISQISPTSF